MKKKSKGIGAMSTWSEAHAYLIRKAENDVAAARRVLEFEIEKLDNIKGMKPPKESA